MPKIFKPPCPFCGERCRIRSSERRDPKLSHLFCICENCGASFCAWLEVYKIKNNPSFEEPKTTPHSNEASENQQPFDLTNH